MSAPVCFVDTETTGVHPGRRAWEVAVIRREPDGTERTLHAFVADVDLSEADPFGLKVGRFYDRHPVFNGDIDAFLNPAPFDEALAAWGVSPPTARCLDEHRVADLVERMTRGAHLVGAVPNFDAEVFADMLRRHRLTPAWHYHLIDVENLAVGYLAGRAGQAGELSSTQTAELISPPWSSEDLSIACGVKPAADDERHTALGDARWAMRLYDAIVGGAR